MPWVGLLITSIGLLMIGGYYLYELFLYLFALEFMPFPVRLALPAVVAGIVLTLISMFWESVKRNRRERLQEMEERLTEHPADRGYLAGDIAGADD